jgi:tetratricopeptide (TPR) repeat protein
MVNDRIAMSSLPVSSSIEREVERIRECSKRGQHRDALNAAEMLSATAPGHRDVLYLIAANQRCLNQVADALATLQLLEQQHPRFSLLYQERGYCYMTLRDARHAIDAFEQAVTIDPAMSTSWIMLERLYRLTGDMRNARVARLEFVRVLIDRQKYQQAREATEVLLKQNPADRESLLLNAAACTGLGDHERAIAVYRELLAGAPDSPELHISLGHALRAVGRQLEAVESYHAASDARPGFGDAYWSLANLKAYRFSREEIARMRSEEAAPAARTVDRYHLCFAIGKALEDRQEYVESWRFYERGNALKHAESRYRPEIDEANTRRQIEIYTPRVFADRTGVGVPDKDPIFVVGLPRSGSTLIEQILASHSRVESTHELAEIEQIALGIRPLAELAPEDIRRLGARYLTETRAYRSGKPFFIDKMPNNFRHIGLMHLMMPNATIIDVRREPVACCFSNLKQLFAAGQEFTYSVDDIARYYRTYLALLRHWDAVLPGRVLHVWYEDIVENLDREVRRILSFSGLEFESACVEFYKTQRSVRTASSEQVRQPIFRESLGQWRNYEPWLGPLKDSLGDALINYRSETPRFPS